MSVEEATRRFEEITAKQDGKIHDLELGVMQRSNNETLKMIPSIVEKIKGLCDHMKIVPIDSKDTRSILENEYNNTCAKLAVYLRNCSIAYKSERKRIFDNSSSRAIKEVEMENNKQTFINDYKEIRLPEKEPSFNDNQIKTNDEIFEAMVRNCATQIANIIAKLNGWLDNNALNLPNPLYNQIRSNIYMGIRKDISLVSVTVSNLELQNVDVVLSESNLEVLDSYYTLQDAILNQSNNTVQTETSDNTIIPFNNQKVKEMPQIDMSDNKAA